ncbi:MAG TPA: sigma 54-interacting transcriptional regulator [Syntrophorhabdales bacterium]|nr:sigma 54-interacting transcriptional regulator [Syntrophorhabdales bacterium]
MQENDFFREFTFRICGSLNIGEALWRCLLYVQSILPAEELILTVYNEDFGTLEVVARADEKGFDTASQKVHMSSELRRELENVEHYSRVRISGDVRQDPIIGRLADHFKWPDSSVIVGRLIIQHKFIGSLIVRADGKNRYSEEDGRLWALVNEPAGIALANSQQYLELLRLKDALADDNRYLSSELQKSVGTEIVGANSGLKDVMDQVYRVAPLSSPVLLTGETGTGKEIIANAIHNLSGRSNGPFITVNCGAIPESLIDSELFGHEKGSFTGALSDRRGRFERADKGTIFLDEVGELPPQAQVRLLRVLQEKEIERVGASQAIKVDIRIISATHRSLEEMVKEGLFRDDLFYRLGVYPISLPPLRERKGDIPELVHYFVEKKAREMGFHTMPALAKGAIERLFNYHWPGNVREIANVVERALIQSDGKSLVFDDAVLVPDGVAPTDGAAAESSDSDDGTPSDGPGRAGGYLKLEEVEARHILSVMEATGGRVEGKKGAASLLGMNPATLRYRMRKLGIPFGRNSIRNRVGG